MFKVAGAFMIIIASGLIGLVIARNYSVRPQQLRYLQSAVQMLETEMLYGLTPLPLALQRVGKRLPYPVNHLFLHTSKTLVEGEGYTAGEAWAASLNELEEQSALLPEDLDTLLYFGQNLGGSDREEQSKNLLLIKEHLKNLEKKAETAKEKNQRLWQYLGFSLGAVVALIIL
ncbi:MAG: stage III sporulation protein SpoIIIAB [Bacillota bacterium]